MGGDTAGDPASDGTVVGATEGAAGEIVDVAVVGYGPVGNALAILLAQLGHRVVVLERQPRPYALPRAVHFDHEAARILQACGIGDDLAGISEPADIYEWRNGAGTALLRIGGAGRGLSGWPRSSMFCQPDLEALLDRRAQALPGVTVRRGVEVTGLVDDGDVVTLRTSGSGVGRPEVRRPGWCGPGSWWAATEPTARSAASSTLPCATSGSSTTGSSWTWCCTTGGSSTP